MTSRSRGRRLAAVSAGLVLAATLAPSPGTAHEAPSASAGQDSAARGVSSGQVLAISLDGFNPNLVTRLGRKGAPNLNRLFRNGASTKNARAQIELTVTLPNHTSQLTGRRIDASEGGHGVTWNDDKPSRPDTIQDAAGEDVASIFTQVHDAGLSTALFATESKFTLFKASWPDAIDRSTVKDNKDLAITKAVRRDLVQNNRAFTFLHLGQLDNTGHDHGWFSPKYLRAGRRIDELLGQILTTIRNNDSLDDLTIVLTADHGGKPGEKGHAAASVLENYRVPFVIWGAGVDKGDLYDMNPTYADPGTSRPLFDADPQPIRNGDLANVCAKLLGLQAVPGSLWGTDQTLTWHN